MRVTRRVKIAVGVVSGGLVLVIGTGVVLGNSGGRSNGAAPAAAEVEDQLERDRPERTTTTATATTASTTAPTTTVALMAPPTTAGQASDPGNDDSTPASRPPAPAPPSTPPPPAPTPTSPPWVDTRPEAIDSSASCKTTGPTTVVGTAIVWSDGFVDEFSVTFTSPGYNQSVGGGQRGWWVTVSVVAPPAGAIGDYTCSNASTGGPTRWAG